MSQFPYLHSAMRVLLFSFLIIFPRQLTAQAPWTVNAADYENNGSIEAIVILDGAEVTTGYLGAFVGDECRGVVEGDVFPPTGKTIFGLMCFSNVSSGEMMSFRYYDPGTDTEYPIQETIGFEADMTGFATDPDILYASLNSAPVASCPDQASMDPAAGPISFDLCTIFSDPDGDALTYDAAASAEATLNWINGCELEVTAAASVTTTLTLSATDGEFTSTCNYSFTVTTNNAPVVDQPVGMRLLDEGFASVQIDLSAVFSDPDGDALSYSAVTINEDIVTTSVSSTILTITEVAAGNTTITVTASDGELSVQDVITVVVMAEAPSPPWSVNVSSYEYSGQLDAVVRVNGIEVNTGILAAFVGDECRGVVKGSYFAPNQKTIFALLVSSNTSSGDILTFRYYDPVSQVVQVIDTVIAFSSNMSLGSANAPVQLNIPSGNNLPQLDNPLADQAENEHFGTLTLEAGVVFSDPDGDVLTYIATIENEAIATVQMDGSTLTITGTGVGTTVVEVFASDGEFSTVDRFVLVVNEVNDPPVVQNGIADQSLLEGFISWNIEISGTFSDPDGDVLSYSTTSNDETVVTVKIEGGNLVITETGTGTAVVSVCVSDGTSDACDQFEIVVEETNESPVALCDNALDRVIDEGFGNYTIADACAAFSDPDSDPLTFSVTSSDESVASVSIDACTITVTEVGIGTTTISICASDGEFEVCCDFTVTVNEVNESPVVVAAIVDQLLQEGFGTENIPVSGTFSDPDGDALTLSATSSDESVVTVSVSGSEVVVTEVAVGTATVTVCANDGELEVCDQFIVVVQAGNNSPEAFCPANFDVVLTEGFGSYGPMDICEAFIDPDDDALTYTISSDAPEVATVSNEGCDVTVTETGTGTATVTVCASDGEYEVCCSFTVEIVAENELRVFLGTEQLSVGDSLKYCSDTVTIMLTVNSEVPWSIEATDPWYTADQVDAGHAKIFLSENTTGEERSSSIAVRDTQDHVLNFVVYQSATCIPDGVAAEAVQGYRVYPNPVQDLVTIELPETGWIAGDVEMRLYAADGRMLRHVTDVVGHDRLLTFEMHAYRPGIYYLVIEEAGAQRVRIPLVK
jgi:uncharacterized protein YjdB